MIINITVFTHTLNTNRETLAIIDLRICFALKLKQLSFNETTVFGNKTHKETVKGGHSVIVRGNSVIR